MIKKIELLEELRDNYDHSFIDQEGIDYFTVPFGLVLIGRLEYDNRTEPKGLMLKTGPGTSATGRGAEEVAEAIAMHVVPDFAPKAYGRGSRLRDAVNTTISHLLNNEAKH